VRDPPTELLILDQEDFSPYFFTAAHNAVSSSVVQGRRDEVAGAVGAAGAAGKVRGSREGPPCWTGSMVYVLLNTTWSTG
jgi:hypothetical protein